MFILDLGPEWEFKNDLPFARLERISVLLFVALFMEWVTRTHLYEELMTRNISTICETFKRVRKDH